MQINAGETAWMLHGTLVFSTLAVALPGALAVFSILLLRLLIRRLGVRVIPTRTPRADTFPSPHRDRDRQPSR